MGGSPENNTTTSAKLDDWLRVHGTALLDALGQGIIVTDPSGVIRYVNAAIAALLARPVADLIGQPVQSVTTPAHAQETASEIMERLRSGQSWSGEFELETANGRIIPALVSDSPVHDENGELIAIIGVTTDLTEQQQVQRELREARAGRRALQDRMQESQSLATLGRVAGGVARDLGNTLTSLQSLVGALKACSTNEDRERILEQFDGVERSLSTLASQLLSFHRPRRLETVPLDVNQLVADTVLLLRRVLPESIEVRITGHVELSVEADLAQIRQVLLDLALNASDALDGRGRIVFELGLRAASNIAAQSELTPGAYVVIGVRDNGPGIPEDARGSVFERFFTTRASGTGLGLSSALQTAEEHRGTLRLADTGPDGTCFELWLPASTRDSQTPTASVTLRERTSREGVRVLLAEDNRLVRESVALVLRSLQYEVTTARTGPQALAILEACQGDVDVAILDVVMPRMSGLELATLVSDRWPKIRQILVTGYSRGSLDMAPVNENQTKVVLYKPFSHAELQDAIARVLS